MLLFFIYREIRWRLNLTNDTPATRLKINELKSLSGGSDFPTGIKFDGEYNNHLNWDAVKIFEYAWPCLDTVMKDNVRMEIVKMLNWCLTQSYQPDGSFKTSDLYDTTGDACSYGVAFLSETGYFQRNNRLWTNQDFPGSNKIVEHIKAKIQSLGLRDTGLKDALETLNGKPF